MSYFYKGVLNKIKEKTLNMEQLHSIQYPGSVEARANRSYWGFLNMGRLVSRNQGHNFLLCNLPSATFSVQLYFLGHFLLLQWEATLVENQHHPTFIQAGQTHFQNKASVSKFAGRYVKSSSQLSFLQLHFFFSSLADTKITRSDNL